MTPPHGCDIVDQEYRGQEIEDEDVCRKDQ